MKFKIIFIIITNNNMQKLTTLERTNRWFQKYQPNLNETEWQELYLKLIEEEYNETMNAIKNNNLIEFLDWCIDLYWVQQWYYYFGGTTENDFVNPFELMFNYISLEWLQLVQEEMIVDLIHAVADSNYTKVLELQTKWNKVGKVIKWSNFVKPTEAIKQIIEKYNITFITE